MRPHAAAGGHAGKEWLSTFERCERLIAKPAELMFKVHAAYLCVDLVKARGRAPGGPDAARRIAAARALTDVLQKANEHDVDAGRGSPDLQVAMAVMWEMEELVACKAWPQFEARRPEALAALNALKAEDAANARNKALVLINIKTVTFLQEVRRFEEAKAYAVGTIAHADALLSGGGAVQRLALAVAAGAICAAASGDGGGELAPTAADLAAALGYAARAEQMALEAGEVAEAARCAKLQAAVCVGMHKAAAPADLQAAMDAAVRAVVLQVQALKSKADVSGEAELMAAIEALGGPKAPADVFAAVPKPPLISQEALLKFGLLALKVRAPGRWGAGALGRWGAGAAVQGQHASTRSAQRLIECDHPTSLRAAACRQRSRQPRWGSA